MAEIWKEISNFGGAYEVSNLGNVRGLDRFSIRSNGSKLFVKGRGMAPSLARDGYLIVFLSKNNAKKNFRVHRLVAEAFLGKVNSKDFVHHKDSDKTNNTVDNLMWVTASENLAFAGKEGKMKSLGEKNGGSKLTEKDVVEIRTLHAAGQKQVDIAKVFKVSSTTVHEIVNRKKWKHI